MSRGAADSVGDRPAVAGRRPLIHIVAAVAQNRVIGMGGRLPWHLPEDLTQFKSLTMGHPIIMGRKTWDSIGRALPGRRNLVVTRNRSARFPGAEAATSLGEALQMAQGADEVFVIGGSRLYQDALALASRMTLTEVDCSPEGDTWFPEICKDDWMEIDRRRGQSASGLGFTVRRLERRC